MSVEEIEFLRSLRLPYTKIAAYLGVSRSTIYRRMEENGISAEIRYTNISDSDLDREIVAIKIDHPNDGERLIIGHLAAQRIIIPRARVRSSIHRVDPENTAIRRSVALRRRVYHVNGPNCLWHIDGHHKLIRWRLVVHGGIDGYSRTVVFLKCSDNNRAYTMLSGFTSGVDMYGIPEKIRTDLGGENVQVWRYMIENHGSTSSVLVGSSTHNQRIERLWRDVFRCVSIMFYTTFTQLENEGYLNPLNETDMFCLHYIFLPKINLMLEAFRESWNNHSLSTAQSLTPNQLFVQGALEQNMVPFHPLNQGSNAGNALPTPGEQVNVPRNQFYPCSSLQHVISDYVFTDNEFGCNVFKELLSVVGTHVSLCSVCS